jgi:hypothetical protein
MSTKAEFNAEEWSKVVEGPMFAGLRVIAADRGGTIRESLAMGRVYAEARKNRGASELLDELVASPPTVTPDRLQADGDIRSLAGDRVREAIRVASEHASADEVEAYRSFVLDVADAAARAHKEGGFIGIGGKEISDSEQAALDELRSILGEGTPGGAGS